MIKTDAELWYWVVEMDDGGVTGTKLYWSLYSSLPSPGQVKSLVAKNNQCFFSVCNSITLIFAIISFYIHKYSIFFSCIFQTLLIHPKSLVCEGH